MHPAWLMDAPTEISRLPLTSADPLAERLAQLRALFPEAAGEGKFDVEKLRALLGEGVAGGPERYGLSWAGKKYLVSRESLCALWPCLGARRYFPVQERAAAKVP